MLISRLRTVCELLFGLRRHDFRAARTFMDSFYPGQGLLSRAASFSGWTLKLMWQQLPETNAWASFAKPVSRTPIWLRDQDPFENHPFAADPSEGSPSLRGRLAEPDHVLADAGLADLDAELQQLTVDARSAPERVVAAHGADQLANVAGNS